MKALALESVVKFIIMIAAASVLLSLVLYFSEEIKSFIGHKLHKDEKVQTKLIEVSSFTYSQLASYIISCWDKTGEDYNEDVICYILKGDMSSVSSSDIENTIDVPVDLSEFDNTKDIAIIEFDSLGKVIVVKSE